MPQNENNTTGVDKGTLPQDLQQDFTKERVTDYQKFLKHFNYYDGKIDSIWGPKTQQAYDAYVDSPPIVQGPEDEDLKSGMKGAGYWGKGEDGQPRTPFKNAYKSL